MTTLVCTSCNMERPRRNFLIIENDGVTYTHHCSACAMLGKEQKALPVKVAVDIAAEVRKIDKEERAAKRAKVKKEKAPGIPGKEVCPNCCILKPDAEFERDGKKYLHCNVCRDERIAVNNERIKTHLGFHLSTDANLGRCYRCGFVGNLEQEFKVDVRSETGRSHYCIKRCKSKRGA